MPDGSTQHWDFSTSPIAWQFRQCRVFASFAIGPVGSGKSVPLLQRIGEHAREQEPSPDGIRRSRFAVVRNTLPELRSTTAVTYQQIYLPDQFGDIVWRSPATHLLHFEDVECEVNLIALDKPKDVKKLLSLELTGAAINEIREVPRSVVNRMTERVGRYGLNERPTTWRGIWGDTNPPDTDHWLYGWHHQDTPHGFRFFQQPPGVLQVQPYKGGAIIDDENFPQWQGVKLSSAIVMVYHKGRVQRVECPIEVIPAADRHWIVNPWQENLAALSRVSSGANPLGPMSYYGQALSGKTLEEIQSYLQGVYTFVLDGRRVVPQYNPQVHGLDHLEAVEGVEIMVGMDIGGGTLQPSALIFQRHPRGPYLALEEVVCFDMGVKRFGELLSRRLVERFPKHVEKGLIGRMWGDPAGETRDEIFETASFDWLRNTHGFKVFAAPSQDPRMRIAALAGPCERMIDGKPGLLVSKSRCPMLHKGLMGAWHYRRLAVSGDERYQDVPNKNEVSHICDGAGYGLLGAGEYIKLGGRSESPDTPMMADGDFDL
ncbi:hypothetical protein DVVG_00034 [Dunaliella viridis virus SI2]|uniref:hypothetical protein n=1 Tax=Dunaliella viridis virus SI2 TaxID=754069 RepID=UPI0002C05B07|nr:hypothetical protein DVVG_00034 [Dunaliella viridis virus SI2]AGH16020.1 hypothetical protein DVVG_00034 [Dunaliella viridis virus SI2]